MQVCAQSLLSMSCRFKEVVSAEGHCGMSTLSAHYYFHVPVAVVLL